MSEEAKEKRPGFWRRLVSAPWRWSLPARAAWTFFFFLVALVVVTWIMFFANENNLAWWHVMWWRRMTLVVRAYHRAASGPLLRPEALAGSSSGEVSGNRLRLVGWTGGLAQERHRSERDADLLDPGQRRGAIGAKPFESRQVAPASGQRARRPRSAALVCESRRRLPVLHRSLLAKPGCAAERKEDRPAADRSWRLDSAGGRAGAAAPAQPAPVQPPPARRPRRLAPAPGAPPHPTIRCGARFRWISSCNKSKNQSRRRRRPRAVRRHRYAAPSNCRRRARRLTPRPARRSAHRRATDWTISIHLPCRNNRPWCLPARPHIGNCSWPMSANCCGDNVNPFARSTAC